jgi:hypothetical protein
MPPRPSPEVIDAADAMHKVSRPKTVKQKKEIESAKNRHAGPEQKSAADAMLMLQGMQQLQKVVNAKVGEMKKEVKK